MGRSVMKKFEKIIFICIVSAMCIALAGCSSISLFKEGEGGEDVVKQFLSAVAKDDSDKARACLVNPSEYESLTTVAKRLGMDEEKTKKFTDQYTSIKYSIEKSVKGNDASRSTVMVFMTVPDYSAAFAKGISETNNGMNSGQALKVIIEKMADTKPETVNKAVAVSVVKSGEDWLIDYSNNNIELVNAINGNVLNALHGGLAI